jgi:protein ImuB
MWCCSPMACCSKPAPASGCSAIAPDCIAPLRTDSPRSATARHSRMPPRRARHEYLPLRPGRAQIRSSNAPSPMALPRSRGRLSYAVCRFPCWSGTQRRTRRCTRSAWRTIGDLLRLPREAFAKRFGAARLDDLDRALGVRPIRSRCSSRPRASRRAIELPADFSETAQLMFPAQRLLASLEGFLRGRNAGATELVFAATHSPRRGIDAAADRDRTGAGRARARRPAAGALLERAADARATAGSRRSRCAHGRAAAPFAALNASLPAAVAKVAIMAGDWLQARRDAARAARLRARVPAAGGRRSPARARLARGADRDRRRQAHRPGAAPARPAAAAAADTAAAADARRAAAVRRAADAGRRPRAHRGRLVGSRRPRLRPPARAVHRDYFVARNARGQWLWIYRELAAPRGWFLHGLFA